MDMSWKKCMLNGPQKRRNWSAITLSESEKTEQNSRWRLLNIPITTITSVVNKLWKHWLTAEFADAKGKENTEREMLFFAWLNFLDITAKKDESKTQTFRKRKLCKRFNLQRMWKKVREKSGASRTYSKKNLSLVARVWTSITREKFYKWWRACTTPAVRR